jgi:hypothetical protein
MAEKTNIQTLQASFPPRTLREIAGKEEQYVSYKKIILFLQFEK